jgi:hypothetical protein
MMASPDDTQRKRCGAPLVGFTRPVAGRRARLRRCRANRVICSALARSTAIFSPRPNTCRHHPPMTTGASYRPSSRAGRGRPDARSRPTARPATRSWRWRRVGPRWGRRCLHRRARQSPGPDALSEESGFRLWAPSGGGDCSKVPRNAGGGSRRDDLTHLRADARNGRRWEGDQSLRFGD